MANITQPVPDAAFELIRKRIGEILASELPEQATLKASPAINADVWVEREAAFTTPELPAVNVKYTSGENNQHAPTAAHFTHSFFIDVYTAAQTTATERGSLTAQKAAQSIVNVCRGILAHTYYTTLDFPRGFIMSHRARNIAVSDASGEDGDYITLARLTFEVSAVEANLPEIARSASGADSELKLEETEKGFKFTINN